MSFKAIYSLNAKASITPPYLPGARAGLALVFHREGMEGAFFDSFTGQKNAVEVSFKWLLPVRTQKGSKGQ